MNVLMQPEKEEGTSPKEYKIPLALLGIGVAIYFVYALIVAGVPGLMAMAMLLPVRIFLQVFLGVIACFLTAKIMGTSFGLLASAIVKLSAIFIFPTAVTFFMPWWLGGLIGLLLYWRLIEYLFDLDAVEAIILTVVIFLVNAGAILLAAFIGMGLSG